MRRAFMKKRYGIPAALLLVLLLSGTALAWYSFNSISSTTNVKEPLKSTGETEFSANMYPGEANTWYFKIVNSADVAYTVKADLTYSAPTGVSITSFTVVSWDSGGNAVASADETSDLKDDGSAEFIIPANRTVSCSLRITAVKDAAPGPVTVSLSLSRR